MLIHLLYIICCLYTDDDDDDEMKSVTLNEEAPTHYHQENTDESRSVRLTVDSPSSLMQTNEINKSKRNYYKPTPQEKKNLDILENYKDFCLQNLFKI